MKCEQGWECDQLVGWCQLHEAEFFQGQLECDLICSEDATIIYNSGCGGELPPQQPWLDYPEGSNTGSKAGSHLVIPEHFPVGKTYQL